MHGLPPHLLHRDPGNASGSLPFKKAVPEETQTEDPTLVIPHSDPVPGMGPRQREALLGSAGPPNQTSTSSRGPSSWLQVQGSNRGLKGALTPKNLDVAFDKHTDYDRSVTDFLAWARTLRRSHGAQLHTIPVADATDRDLATRVLHLPATGPKATKTLVLVAGTHGAEAAFGATAMEGFLRNHLPNLDRSETQVFLVHGLNPWGWRHNSQFTADNTDPNRSVKGEGARPGPHYGLVQGWATADQPPARFLPQTVMEVVKGVAASLVRAGFDSGKVTRALAEGQDVDPAGFRFMGEGELPQVQVLRDHILRPALEDTKDLFFYDYHTGLLKSGVVHVMNMARDSGEAATDTITEGVESDSLVRVGRGAGPYDTSAVDLTNIAHQAAPPEALVRAATVEAGGFPPGHFPLGLDGDSQVALLATLVRQYERNQMHHHPEEVSSSKKEAILRRYRQLFNPDPQVDPAARDWRQSVFSGAERLMARTVELLNAPSRS